jgi:hypothetical protein
VRKIDAYYEERHNDFEVQSEYLVANGSRHSILEDDQCNFRV